MQRQLQGTYETISTLGENVDSFIPNPLPPEPPITFSPKLQEKFDQAHLALGKLDSISILVPDTSLFLYMYVRKEAVLSSMVEGTQSSLSDLLLFELKQEPGVPIDDVEEVSNYVAALNYGLQRIRDGFPISLRLFREIHGILLRKGRGQDRNPGEFRTSQNWIGGSRPKNASFVPPPPHKLMQCMGDLELFLHDHKQETPPLLKAGLFHVQFETIHPFLDGNGRLGRLLIPLLLCEQKILQEPLLYISLYFKTYRQEYYKHLNDVRATGDWEEWLSFFADAVIATANQAVKTTKQLVDISKLDAEKIQTAGIPKSSLAVYRELVQHPITTAMELSQRTELSLATVNKCLKNLEDIAIVNEVTHKKRNRIFVYTQYIEALNQGLNG